MADTQGRCWSDGGREAGHSLQTGSPGSEQLWHVQNTIFLVKKEKKEKSTFPPTEAGSGFLLENTNLQLHHLDSPSTSRPEPFPPTSCSSSDATKQPIAFFNSTSPAFHSGRGQLHPPQRRGLPPRGAEHPSRGLFGVHGWASTPPPSVLILRSLAGSTRARLCSCFLRFGCVYSQHE